MTSKKISSRQKKKRDRSKSEEKEFKKVQWMLKLEAEEINDERWSCCVVAAIERYTSDEKIIKLFNQTTSKNLRPHVKIIKATDILTKMKTSNEKKGKHSEPTDEYVELIDIVSKHCSKKGNCQLPPYIMALVIKYIVLQMKKEDITRLQLKILQNEEELDMKLKSKLLERYDSKPETPRKTDKTMWKKRREIEDAPHCGEQLYIVLSGFYEPQYFIEMKHVGVPLVCLLCFQQEGSLPSRNQTLEHFWTTFESHMSTYDNNLLYKDITMVSYSYEPNQLDNKDDTLTQIFDEVSHILYEVALKYQHSQLFLRQNRIHCVEEVDGKLKLSECKDYLSMVEEVDGNVAVEYYVLHCMIVQVLIGFQECSDIDLSCLSHDWTQYCGNVDSEEIDLQKLWESPPTIQFGDTVALHYVHSNQNIRDVVKHMASKSPLKHLWGIFDQDSHSKQAYYNYHLRKLCSRNNISIEEYVEMLDRYCLVRRLQEVEETVNEEYDHPHKHFEDTFFTTWTFPKTFEENEEEAEEEEEKVEERGEGCLTDKEVNCLRSMLLCSDVLSLIIEHPNEQMNHYKTHEVFQQNVMSQVLQSACNNCNSVSHQYRPLTGSILLVFYNVTNEEGFYQKNYTGHINTPVKMRDFHRFVIKDEPFWIKQIEERYEEFSTNAQTEEQRIMKLKEYEKWSKLLEDYENMTEEQRENFLSSLRREVAKSREKSIDSKKRAKDRDKSSDSKKETKNRENDRSKSGEKKKNDGKKEKGSGKHKSRSRENDKENEPDLPPLPIKLLPEISDDVVFDSFDLSEIREQVNINKLQWFSKDGTRVTVHRYKWLYRSSSWCQVQVQKKNVTLYTDTVPSQKERRCCHIRHTCGVNIASDSKQTQLSLPTGLCLEQVNNSDCSYIRQKYNNKETRCFLPNGNLIILEVSGNVRIWNSSGIITTCYNFETEEESNEELITNTKSPRNNKKRKKKKSSSRERVKSPSEKKEKNEEKKEELVTQVKHLVVRDYNYINSLGECWVKSEREKCSPEPRLLERLKFSVGVAKNEIFISRSDGTKFMYWADGVLVTSFKDGTKITCTAFFGEEIVVDWTDEEIKSFQALEKRNLSSSRGYQRSLVTFSSVNAILTSSFTNSVAYHFTEPFVTIECSYLYEHPNYASVYFDSSGIVTVDLPHDIQVELEKNKIQLKLGEVDIKITGDDILLITRCADCSKPSVVAMEMEPTDKVIKIRDLFENDIIVLENGDIIKSVDGIQSYIEDEEFGVSEETQYCPHRAIDLKLEKRGFVYHRDLTGSELIQHSKLSEYLSHLKRESLVQKDIPSKNRRDTVDKIYSPLQFTPMETWKMSYRKNNALPVEIKKKDMKSDIVMERPYRLAFPRKKLKELRSTSVLTNPSLDVKPPRVIILRTLMSITPDWITLTKELQEDVKYYQDTAHYIINKYLSHDTPDIRTQTQKHVDMRLKRIALTLNQQTMEEFKHYMTQVPSTDDEIHYWTHKLNRSEKLSQDSAVIGDLKTNLNTTDQFLLPQCRNIPATLRHGDSQIRKTTIIE